MASSPLESALFDKSAALERLGGDDQLFRELVDYFLEDSEKLLLDIEAALPGADWQAVRLHAHSLKGLSANFSARRATDVARELEQAADGKSPQQTASLAVRLRSEVEALRTALQEVASQAAGE